MKVIYNSRLVEEADFKLSMNDRAFQYGDGIFESIAVRDSQPSFLDRHYSRLERGSKALKMIPPEDFDLQTLTLAIDQLLVANTIEHGRLRLQMWRKPGGLYSPSTSTCNFLIVPQQAMAPRPIENSDICKDTFIAPNQYSPYKTCNALPYVLASIEKTEKSLDELIILNYHQQLCECTSSNLFWVMGENIYTPTIDTGCIDGIMRSVVLDAQKQSNPVREVAVGAEILSKADQIFATNASGIRYFQRFINRNLDAKPRLEERLLEYVIS